MSLSASALLHMRPGRSRQQRNARRPDGRSAGERPTDVLAVAKSYRIKFGATPETALDYRHGSTIGQLCLEGSISAKQLTIAQGYLGCVISNARLHGLPSLHARALDLASPFGGRSVALEPDQESIDRIVGQFRDCRRVLLDCGQDLLVGSAINRVVYGVVVEDWPRHIVGSDDVQNLRCGLNALGKVFK